MFIQWANWHWVFYLVVIMALPAAAACVVLIPNVNENHEKEHMTQSQKIEHLDLIGVGGLTGENCFLSL